MGLRLSSPAVKTKEKGRPQRQTALLRELMPTGDWGLLYCVTKPDAQFMHLVVAVGGSRGERPMIHESIADIDFAVGSDVVSYPSH